MCPQSKLSGGKTCTFSGFTFRISSLSFVASVMRGVGWLMAVKRIWCYKTPSDTLCLLCARAFLVAADYGNDGYCIVLSRFRDEATGLSGSWS